MHASKKAFLSRRNRNRKQGDTMAGSEATLTEVLERVAAAAVAVATKRRWCNEWYSTFTRLSVAYSTERDFKANSGHRIVIDADCVAGVKPSDLGLSLEEDFTEAGRAKLQESQAAAAMAELIAVRNRLAYLAREGTVTADEANSVIAAMGDPEAFPLITTSPPEKYAYLPSIKFTPSNDSTVDLEQSVMAAFTAWLAGKPEIAGVSGDVTVFDGSVEVRNMRQTATYGNVESLIYK
jgi:hypothetical protein